MSFNPKDHFMLLKGKQYLPVGATHCVVQRRASGPVHQHISCSRTIRRMTM
jgi:hypothetical protein